MDLQSLVMNLLASIAQFVPFLHSLHGVEVFWGLQHQFHEPPMEADMQGESVCMRREAFVAAL